MVQHTLLVYYARAEAGKDPVDSSISAWYCYRDGHMIGGLWTSINVHLIFLASLLAYSTSFSHGVFC